MSHATATPDTAGTAGGESPTEREEPGPAAGTPERSTPESQTFITAFDHGEFVLYPFEESCGC